MDVWLAVNGMNGKTFWKQWSLGKKCKICLATKNGDALERNIFVICENDMLQNRKLGSLQRHIPTVIYNTYEVRPPPPPPDLAPRTMQSITLKPTLTGLWSTIQILLDVLCFEVPNFGSLVHILKSNICHIDFKFIAICFDFVRFLFCLKILTLYFTTTINGRVIMATNNFKQKECKILLFLPHFCLQSRRWCCCFFSNRN